MDNYNTPFYEAPPEPVVPNKFPWPGTISLALAVISVILVCIMFIMLYSIGNMVSNNPTSYQDPMTGMSLGVMGLLCGTVGASLLGLGLGIWGTIQNSSSKITGIIGLILNGLIAVGVCCFFGFAFAVAGSM